IGATNVFRVLGPVPAILAFTLDLLKGILAIYLIMLFTDRPEIIVISGLCAIIGHTFPVFLKFKGGRGAATGLGILLGIAPEIFIAAVITVALIILITRYVSVASIITPILVMVAFIIMQKPLPYTIAMAIITFLIIVRHIPNIKRLLKRKENKIW
ncbi:MAG: glycerol-3-phosphate acyltransferase, partial [Candidatus Margulisiibacteriota bacterium]|nr:glycerol-3-phosphate acyltransferase [Candidatus Margulisiibacteriota bacterium]